MYTGCQMPSQAPEHLTAIVAANIDRAIAKAGKTNREIGTLMNASETQVWKWRKAKHGISHQNLMRMAEVLGHEPAWFYSQNGKAPVK